jgi:hypothetical protein
MAEPILFGVTKLARVPRIGTKYFLLCDWQKLAPLILGMAAARRRVDGM